MGFEHCSLNLVEGPYCDTVEEYGYYMYTPKAPPPHIYGWCDFGFLLDTTALDLKWLAMNGRCNTGREDDWLCWGTVDGFKLLAMQKKWLQDKYKPCYDQGDGEWFVTTCLTAGIELEYAIALRSAIIRHMELAKLNSSNFCGYISTPNGKEFDDVREDFADKFRSRWDWPAIRQLTIDIKEGRAPAPVIVRKGDEAAYLEKVESLFPQQNYAEAVKQLEYFVQVNPRHSRGLFLLAKSLYNLAEEKAGADRVHLLEQAMIRLTEFHQFDDSLWVRLSFGFFSSNSESKQLQRAIVAMLQREEGRQIARIENTHTPHAGNRN